MKIVLDRIAVRCGTARLAIALIVLVVSVLGIVGNMAIRINPLEAIVIHVLALAFLLLLIPADNALERAKIARMIKNGTRAASPFA